MKLRRRILTIILLLATLSVACIYFGIMKFVLVDGRNVKSYSSVQVSTHRKTTKQTEHKTTTVAKFKPDIDKLRRDAERLREDIRNFVKKYAPDYPKSPYEFLKLLRKKAVNQAWSPNASQTELFRKDLLAATGFMDASRLLYLTKENTPVGTKLHFYQKGDPVVMSHDFWKILPDKTDFEPNVRFKRCSIVGSSGMLTGSGCGKEIDKADFIFRFNLADVKGYEEDVGTKTNFTTVNPSILKNTMNSLVGKENIAAYDALQRQFQDSILWIPGFSQPGYYKFVQRIANVTAASGIMKPVVQHPGHYIAMMRLWRALHRRNDWPSTGLYVVSSAFELCDEIEVFGFWFYEISLEGVKVPYHYHNDVMYGTRHSRFKEFQDLVRFHEMGILKMHFGSCR